MCYQVPDKSHLMQQIPTFVWICQTQTFCGVGAKDVF